MKTYTKKLFRYFDFPLFFVYLLLCLFGLVMIYSSSMVVAVGRYDYPADYYFQKQLLNLKLAIPAFFLAAFFPYKNYKRKKLMIFAVIGMLVSIVSGSFRWYR